MPKTAQPGTLESCIDRACIYARERRKSFYVIQGFNFAKTGTYAICEAECGERTAALVIVDTDGNWVEGPKAKELPIGYHSRC